MSPLADWQNFYVIVGGAAGALTGLQFVVMALIADMPMRNDEGETANAFATPTIVHFVAVLMLAASLSMPWHSLVPAAVAWVTAGVCGLAYTFIVQRRMKRQFGYEPVLEDWAFHTMLPAAAYGGLAIAAALLAVHLRGSLFGIGVALLLLLTVGIHNAWDNVTYLVILRRERIGLNKPDNQ